MCERGDAVMAWMNKFIHHIGIIKRSQLFYQSLRWGQSFIVLMRKETSEREVDTATQLKLPEKVKSFSPALNANGQTIAQWKTRSAETQFSVESMQNNRTVRNTSYRLMFKHQRQEVGGWEREMVYCFNAQPWTYWLILRLPLRFFLFLIWCLIMGEGDSCAT